MLEGEKWHSTGRETAVTSPASPAMAAATHCYRDGDEGMLFLQAGQAYRKLKPALKDATEGPEQEPSPTLTIGNERSVGISCRKSNA